MRLGFQYPSPFERIEHHRYGDDGWQVTVHGRGDVWRYSTITAFAHFGPDRPAEPYTDHPGEIAILARLHIELDACGWLESEDRFQLSSEQVAAILGKTEGARRDVDG